MRFEPTTLAPHQPLEPGDPRYVSRPQDLARRIVKRVENQHTVLFAGPAGVGKSTEIGAVAHALRENRAAVLLHADRYSDLHPFKPTKAVLWMAREVANESRKKAVVVELETDGHLASEMIPRMEKLIRDIERALRSVPIHDSVSTSPVPLEQAVSWLNDACTYLSALFSLRPCLLVDGLEKLNADGVLAILKGLEGRLPNIDLVCVIPMELAYASRTDRLSRPEILRALSTSGEGVAFLRELIERRAGAGADDARGLLMADPAIIERTFAWSGGIPRDLLQLVEDAAFNAFDRHSTWQPDERDLRDAGADLAYGSRAAMIDGDKERLRAIDATDGTGLDPATRLRLFSSDLLVEYEEGEKRVVRVHPIVKKFVLE